MPEEFLGREMSQSEVRRWADLARDQTLETLPGFLQSVYDEIPVSFSNIIHKMGIAAIAAASALNNSKQGGIPYPHLGFVGPEFLIHWNRLYGEPMHLIRYDDMLYPQYENKFTTISKDVWARLQEKARENLKKHPVRYSIEDCGAVGWVHPEIWDHWKSIADGTVPFGYRVY